MISEYGNDGQTFEKDWLKDNDFAFNEDRDYRKRFIKDVHTGEATDEYEYVLNFVGFIVNEDNEVFSVFPKNYRVDNLNENSSNLFNVIAKHMQKRPELYLGEEYGKKFKTNYPFAAFFGVYDYYSKYGLYFADTIFVRPNAGGKVNWKETIRLSGKYVSNNRVSFFPLYYNKKYNFTTFLTECMIYSIDYTLNKFGVFIGFENTGLHMPEFDFLKEKEVVLENLYSLRQQTFKDSLITLIDHLINFFLELHEGGSFYLKHYSFSTVWEDMVLGYLKANYKEITNDKIVLDPSNAKNIQFSKPRFHPNEANRNQYFEPDYYYQDGSTQLIFDAKYYTSSRGMDYKQIAYYLFLNEQRDAIAGPPKFSKTHSALILPSVSRSNKLHFKMDPLFNTSNEELVISEEYFDISEVMKFYA